VHKLAIVFLVAGCKSSEPAPANDPPIAPPPPTTKPKLEASHVIGYWTGDWGKLVLRGTADAVRGSYEHDQGTLTGKLVGDSIIGWWCEAKPRTPPQDAGEVVLRFVDDNGKRAIDGKWRYGTEGEWKENWDLHFDVAEPPVELVRRFEDPAQFCAHP
jgi:hypothetical protein